MGASRRLDLTATFSIGAVTFLALPDSVDEMLRAADGFMYEVKRSGKDDMKLDAVGDAGAPAGFVRSDGAGPAELRVPEPRKW